jgi:F-type H+-transporting ATPase subunit b
MFECNGTLAIFLISFLVFMILLDAIMLKPVGRAIAKRQEKMQNDLDAAREARSKATALVESYESHLKQKRSEAHALITTAVASGNKEKSEKLADLHKDGLAKMEAAKTAIAAERESLIDELVAQERELVEAITQKVLGETVAVHLDASKVRQNLEGA